MWCKLSTRTISKARLKDFRVFDECSHRLRGRRTDDVPSPRRDVYRQQYQVPTARCSKSAASQYLPVLGLETLLGSQYTNS